MTKDNNIKCDVTDCKYQNNDDNCCSLEEIKVTSSNDNNEEKTEKEDTRCDSYESIDEEE